MFLYMRMPDKDAVDKRQKQIEYLANEFKEDPLESSEYTLVSEEEMQKGSKRKLFILGHGSQHSYMGQSAETMHKYLKDVGLTDKHFAELWLMPCLVGLQEQDNSVTDNFARSLMQLFRQDESLANMKIYAPRNVVVTRFKDGQVKKIFVRADNKEYGFKDGGWLLMHF